MNTLYGWTTGSPAAATAQRTHLGAKVDWENHRPQFVAAVGAAAAQLNFGTADSLAGHAVKHLPRAAPRIPAAQADVEALVDTYLQEARAKITATPAGQVTSALSQTGTTRTYLFGTVLQHAAMVAVNDTGDAWITTYYAPHRT